MSQSITRTLVSLLLAVAPVLAYGPPAAAAQPSAPSEIPSETLPGALSETAPDADVSGSIDLFRADPANDADPLAADIERMINLGRIQAQNGELVVAKRTLEDAVASIEDAYGIWDQRIVSATAELGAVTARLGDLDAAVGLYEQAVHVNRINQGLHDISQLGMLRDLSALRASQGDWESANEIQEYVYYVQQREYGSGSPAMVPGLYRFAEWLQRSGGIYKARVLYQNAVAILENAYGPEDIRLVDALQGVATTYRLERYPVASEGRREAEPGFTFSTATQRHELIVEDNRTSLNRYGEGEAALARIVGILEAHPETSPRERAEALLDLGDWYLIFDKWGEAFDAYAQARDLLAAAGWDDARIDPIFGEPLPLVFPLPPAPTPPAYATDLTEQRGFVDLTYDISDRGRVEEINIVAAQPEGLMDFRTRRAIKSARFRPRFVDGEPVETTGVQYRHSFVYYEKVAPAEG
ncbi:MAG TPA: energy transducer TonB [Pseudomonadales bacterium]|nr:energy transducer TonB [Pseudomonadales bacterium]